MITAPPPELIDIGANLGHESFRDDLHAVLTRAGQVGVHRLIVTGTSIEATQSAIALHRQWPQRLFATAGVHPHHASNLDDDALAALSALARDEAVVAIGECGLDYFRDFSPREAQREAFHRQLELAAGLGKPVFLHQRDAHQDFLAILKEHRANLSGGVAHCFTGNAQEMEDYLALDLAIGITGWICDERRGQHLLPLIPMIPAGQLMIETDAPYLLPRTLRPAPKTRRNEPSWLPEVARVVAQARGESVTALAEHTTATAAKFFALPATN
ncbi:MAG: TatD family hydrolase [Nevskiaceae bacterium]|jgi:TatD DNase family protein|nr:TatD family hydrolase [Nevskiaceae bacterium]